MTKIKDFATGKLLDLGPEEEIRQAYERYLHFDLKYPKHAMKINVPIKIGRKTCYCDIAVYDQRNNLVGIVETKSLGANDDGEDQLRSYMSATPTCKWGVYTNGETEKCGYKDATSGEVNLDQAISVPAWGSSGQPTVHKYDDLQPASNLKRTFRIINALLYANTNLARTEKQGAEMVKLIFSKLVDEHIAKDEGRAPEFQLRKDEGDKAFRGRIVKLWDATKEHWQSGDIFKKTEAIEIDNYSLKVIISKLQRYTLLKTNRDVVGDAFEVFSGHQFAGEKGQFFTPRPVVNMIVEMTDPKSTERIVDPACGSGGFLISTLSHITANTSDAGQKKQIAEHSLFGIDKDGDLSKICKAHMCIIGDGKSNICSQDSLKDPESWGDLAKGKFLENGHLRQFDVCMANPPFGSKIKVEHKHVLKNYDLGHSWKYNKRTNRWEKQEELKKTAPQVLFIELCLRLLKPSGRLGIVLPDGLLGNPNDGYIRQWIKEKAEILAVVDCPVETFMPHTGTKTSVIIMQKFPATLGRGETFLAISEHCGHTNRGTETGKEDFSKITENFLDVENTRKREHLGFYPRKIKEGILVPRYYDPRILRKINKLKRDNGMEFVSVKEMCEDNMIVIEGVPTSATSQDYDIHGTVRFIRTSDISQLELSENTQKKVSEETYQKHKEKQDLKKEDILFVKDGDNKVGQTAVLLDDEDLHVLVQTHFKKIRPIGMNVYLLLWQLNTDIVKQQIRQRVFSQSTLSTIGQRINELMLPIPSLRRDKNRIISEVKAVITQRREALRKFSQSIKIKG